VKEAIPLSRRPTSIVLKRAKRGQSQAIGRNKGGPSTKIHATVDVLGNPIGFHLNEV
jgi:hypothetical protein